MMKGKLVFFFLANEFAGGIEMLFIRLAKILQQEYDVFILDNCKTSIFHALLKDDNVSFLNFDFKGTNLPDNAVVVAPLNYPNLVGCFKGKNLKFLFWSLYDKNALCMETYRWLHLFENKFQINFSEKTEKFLMRLMNPVLYKHLKVFYKIANEKQALIHMVKDNIIFDEAYFDIKLKENIVPLGLELKAPIQLNMNPSHIRACWLGRFVGFKYNAIKSIIVDLHHFCKENPKITIHLDLIGYGDFENQIKQDCLNYTRDNFIPKIKGPIIGEALQTYLQNKVDLLCAHGTAILEGAKYGIPSLICTGGIGLKKIDYLWLYDAHEGYTGSMYFNPPGYTMEMALNNLIRSYSEIGKKCYNHCDKYFNVIKITHKFLGAIHSTQLTLKDLKETKITKHTFWVKKIEWLRKAR